MPDRFTNAYVRSLTPKTKEYVKRDGVVKGLGLRVHPTGGKSWVFFYDHHGRRRKLTLGTYPEISLKEARTLCQQARVERSRGVDPAQAKQDAIRRISQTPTVAELAEMYIQRYARQQKKTWEEDRRILHKDVIPRWKNRLVTEIRRRDVGLLLDAIAGRGAPFSANSAQVVLSAMFNYAVEMEYLPANPASGLSKRGKYRRRERQLSDMEIRLFFQALDKHDGSVLKRGLFLLQLLTATRPSEVRDARWTEIDLEEGTWSLAGTRTKNQRGHLIPLSSPALGLLESLPRLNDLWVFPSLIRDQPMSRYNQAATVRRLFEKGHLQIERFTPHDLRRTASTHLAKLGTDRFVISKILNHQDEHTTAIYDRYLYMREKSEALEGLGEHLMAILHGSEARKRLVQGV